MLPSSPWDPLSPSCRGGCSHTEDRSSFWFCFQFCSAACRWLVATGMRSQRAHGARDSLKPPIPMKVHPSPTSSDLCSILPSASVRAGWDCVVLLCSCPGWGEHPRAWPPAQLSAEETSSFRVSSANSVGWAEVLQHLAPSWTGRSFLFFWGGHGPTFKTITLPKKGERSIAFLVLATASRQITREEPNYHLKMLEPAAASQCAAPCIAPEAEPPLG